MHLKLLIPTEYLSIGMRENTYIVAFIVLVSMILVFFWRQKIEGKICQYPLMRLLVRSVALGVQIAFVFVFLQL